MIQFDTETCNARLDATREAIGPAPTLEIRTGPKPMSCADEATGLLLVSAQLPTEWMSPAANAVMDSAGTWPQPIATAGGQAGYFRLIDQSGRCRLQGDVTDESGDGDMAMAAVDVVKNVRIQIAGFALVDGNE